MAKIKTNLRVWGDNKRTYEKGDDEHNHDKKSNFDFNAELTIDIDDALIKKVEASMIERKLDAVISLLKERFSKKEICQKVDD